MGAEEVILSFLKRESLAARDSLELQTTCLRILDLKLNCSNFDSTICSIIAILYEWAQVLDLRLIVTIVAEKQS